MRVPPTGPDLKDEELYFNIVFIQVKVRTGIGHGILRRS
jgi:hypothetical protein